MPVNPADNSLGTKNYQLIKQLIAEIDADLQLVEAEAKDLSKDIKNVLDKQKIKNVLEKITNFKD